MKQTIVYVIESAFALGPAFPLRQLIGALANNDLELHVVLFDANESASTPFFENANVHVLPKERFLVSEASRLRTFLDSLRPDIVHAWGYSTQTVCAIAGTHRGSKLITSVFEKPHNDSGLFRRCAAWFKPHTIIADDETTAQFLGDSGIRTQSVIRNMVGPKKCDRAAARSALVSTIGINAREDVYIAGTVTSFEPRFRLKDLVWAIDLLCRVRHDVHLVIFGEGDNRDILRYLSNLECENNIHFVSNADCPMELIGGLDMYWNCQRQQALPPAMLFAMQQSIPVISILADETRETILPLRSALATNYGSRDEFARWTKYLIEIPGAADQLGIQGQQHVENMLLKQSMVDDYRKLYADLARTA